MTDPHAADAAAGHGGAPGHDDHGGDEHGHGGTTLGPIDWPMWGVGVLGVVVALVMTCCFVVASGYTFAG